MENNLVLADTNVILRYLREDDPKLSPQAKLFFEKAKSGQIKIYFDGVIVAEVVWVLDSVYKADREQITTQLTKLISQEWIICLDKELVLNALNQFKKVNISYIDCWLLAVSKKLTAKIETFDLKLKKQL